MSDALLPAGKQAAFLDSALYATFSLVGREEDELVKFFYGGGTLDAWCPRCTRPSVFKIAGQLPDFGHPKKTLPHTGLIIVSAACTRGTEDGYGSGCRQPLHIVFAKDVDEVRKVGQSPSAADLALGALDVAFDKELDPARRRELGTAIGLQAHGVGIGSFVYLRRIFEALLEEAHQEARLEAGWDEPAYPRARVQEKIQLLHAHLPSRLVASADLYRVLSGGVHELSDRECLENFGLVKAAIELILKERHETKRYDAVIKGVASRKLTS